MFLLLKMLKIIEKINTIPCDCLHEAVSLFKVFSQLTKFVKTVGIISYKNIFLKVSVPIVNSALKH